MVKLKEQQKLIADYMDVVSLCRMDAAMTVAERREWQALKNWSLWRSTSLSSIDVSIKSNIHSIHKYVSNIPAFTNTFIPHINNEDFLPSYLTSNCLILTHACEVSPKDRPLPAPPHHNITARTYYLHFTTTCYRFNCGLWECRGKDEMVVVVTPPGAS